MRVLKILVGATTGYVGVAVTVSLVTFVGVAQGGQADYFWPLHWPLKLLLGG